MFYPTGFPGIGGRQCNETSKGADNCNTLCCGYGYDTQRKLVKTQCDCKFQWCCFIDCKTCQKWKDLHFCRASNDTIMSNSTWVNLKL